MSIVAVFKICVVCGADVMTLADSDEIPSCASHSNEDRRKALKELQRRLDVTLARIMMDEARDA